MKLLDKILGTEWRVIYKSRKELIQLINKIENYKDDWFVLNEDDADEKNAIFVADDGSAGFENYGYDYKNISAQEFLELPWETFEKPDKIKFLESTLHRYAEENSVLPRSTSDLSPLEAWLIHEMYALTENIYQNKR